MLVEVLSNETFQPGFLEFRQFSGHGGVSWRAKVFHRGLSVDVGLNVPRGLRGGLEVVLLLSRPMLRDDFVRVKINRVILAYVQLGSVLERNLITQTLVVVGGRVPIMGTDQSLCQRGGIGKVLRRAVSRQSSCQAGRASESISKRGKGTERECGNGVIRWLRRSRRYLRFPKCLHYLPHVG